MQPPPSGPDHGASAAAAAAPAIAAATPGVANTPADGTAPVAPADVPRVIAEQLPEVRQRPVRLVLRMDPPELGRVHVSLVARGDDVHVVLRVEAPGAAEALQVQRERLAQAFADDGLNLSSFDIGDSSARTPDGDDRRRQQGPSRPRLTPSTESFDAADDGELRL